MKRIPLLRTGIMILAVVFALSTIGSDLALAKGGGFGGGSRGGGSRSSFGGGSKPASQQSAPPAAPSKPSSGFSGGSKTSAQSTPSSAVKAPANKPTQTKLQAKQSRESKRAESAKALQSLKVEKNKFTAPPAKSATPTSTQNAVLGKVGSSGSSSNIYVSRNTYYVNRDHYYGGWNRPAYIYSYPSSFGMWDAMFLWMMLDSSRDHEFYYHHQNDPAIQEWRQDAEKQAETNGELKAKLAALDAKVKDMQTQGVKPDESFVPADAGAAVLSAEVVEKNLPEQTPEEIQAELVENTGGHPWLWVGIVIFVMIVVILAARQISKR